MLALVVGNAHATVAADHHVIAIARVNPHGVKVHVDSACTVLTEGLAAVVGHVHRRGRLIHAQVICRIDANQAKIHGTLIRASHLAPRNSRVVRSVRAPLLRMLHARVDDARILPVDVESNASHRSFRQPLREARPRSAGVGALPNATVRSSAIHAPAGAASLINGRIQDFVVDRIHYQFSGACVGSGVQHLHPGEPAVDGLVDAALTTGRPQITKGGNVHHLMVGRIDHDARHLL